MSKDSRFDKLDEEFKTKLFLDCWMYAHGFSTLIATNYFKDVSDDFIKERLVEGAATMLYKRLRDYNKKVNFKRAFLQALFYIIYLQHF